MMRACLVVPRLVLYKCHSTLFKLFLLNKIFFTANTEHQPFWDNFGLYLTILGEFAVVTVVTQ